MDIKGKIVFSSGKIGDYDIWTLDLASKEIKQLTTGSYWNDCPKWSPDGEKIIFISNRSGTPEIWLMNEDGTNQKQLTTKNRWHNTPSWSADGKKIVFCANYDGNVDVYTMNNDGSNLVQITDYAGMDFAPQFSPDGTEIIFTSQRSGNDDIWTFNVATKRLRQLTTYKDKDFSPTYSPDGSLIAFVCDEDVSEMRENLEIYLMDRDGNNRRRVTKNAGTDRHVAWSPDAQFLIYTASGAHSTAERFMIMSVEKMKGDKIRFDRHALESEIDVEVRAVGVFCLLPESIVRKTYPDSYFGTERYPHWKF